MGTTRHRECQTPSQGPRETEIRHVFGTSSDVTSPMPFNGGESRQMNQDAYCPGILFLSCLNVS